MVGSKAENAYVNCYYVLPTQNKVYLIFIPFDDLQFVFGETEYPTDQFDIIRKSKDDTCNRFGAFFIGLCCTHSIHVLNGRLFDDCTGEITCVSNNGRSVSDYMLASTRLFNSFTHF